MPGYRSPQARARAAWAAIRGGLPPIGFAFITTNLGADRVTTNNGADRVIAKVI